MPNLLKALTTAVYVATGVLALMGLVIFGQAF